VSLWILRLAAALSKTSASLLITVLSPLPGLPAGLTRADESLLPPSLGHSAAGCHSSSVLTAS
jgi:hypothetical protein